MKQFSNVDDGPTKQFLISHQTTYPKCFRLCFGKRPKEELYNLQDDPYQLVNRAHKEEYQKIKAQLSKQLTHYLKSSNDQRFVPSEVNFDTFEYRKN